MSRRYFATALGAASLIDRVPQPGGGIVKICRWCKQPASICESTREAWAAQDAESELAEQLDVHRSGVAA